MKKKSKKIDFESKKKERDELLVKVVENMDDSCNLTSCKLRMLFFSVFGT